MKFSEVKSNTVCRMVAEPFGAVLNFVRLQPDTFAFNALCLNTMMPLVLSEQEEVLLVGELAVLDSRVPRHFRFYCESCQEEFNAEALESDYIRELRGARGLPLKECRGCRDFGKSKGGYS